MFNCDWKYHVRQIEKTRNQKHMFNLHFDLKYVSRTVSVVVLCILTARNIDSEKSHQHVWSKACKGYSKTHVVVDSMRWIEERINVGFQKVHQKCQSRDTWIINNVEKLVVIPNKIDTIKNRHLELITGGWNLKRVGLLSVGAIQGGRMDFWFFAYMLS